MSEKLHHKTLEARIYNLRLWVETINPNQLKEMFNSILADAKFKVLNFSEYHFPVQGYTAMWLLAESHLAIHTFPQNNWSYIELSGCNKSKTNQFKTLLLNSELTIKWESDTILQTTPEVSTNESIEL